MDVETPLVLVVDDDISVRESLKSLLRSDGLSVEALETPQALMESLHRQTPGCIILDVRLPGASGLDLQEQLAGLNLEVPIIFISAHGDIQMSVRAMKAGALEFFPKPFRDQDLLDAVREALNRDRTVRAERAEASDFHSRYESLSPREHEVMTLVVRGLPNKNIAVELDVSEATVKLHRGRLMQKMQAYSLADLVSMAQKLGVPIGKGHTEAAG